VIAGGVAAVLLVILVAAILVMPAFTSLDATVSEWVRGIGTETFEPIFRDITRIADPVPMVVLIVSAGAVLWALGKRPEAILLVVTVSVGWLLGEVLKELVERSRPGLEFARIPLPDSYSFPSSHALAAFLFFATIAFIVMLEAKTVTTRILVAVLCFIAAAAVSLSRVYLGVHWFGDILASWVLGAAWMTVTVSAYFWFTREEGS
jgi:undecaprenyl-diphosphatase